ncbi:MAG: MBL fold metallo-hydrolase [Clostridia bacterium]|nr:MBL fold metallo-hydrolase [Clostridia bacterium]
MNYKITRIECGMYAENAYLICPEEGNKAILIDPGDDLNRIKRYLADSGKTLGAILLTHGHFDHMLAAEPLNKITGANVYVHAGDENMLCDERLCAYDPNVSRLPCPKDIEAEILEDSVDLFGLHFDVLHTPGHTPGSVCYYDKENKVLFSGDTLFCAGFGRMDLPGGSAKEMRTSLKKLFDLPGDVKVYSGHGCETTIADERGRYHL